MLNDPAEIAAVLGALHGCETIAVELLVDPSVLEQRIRLRDSGVRLVEHLAFLDAYDAEGAEARADAVIDVDDQSPAQVAREVLGVAGW